MPIRTGTDIVFLGGIINQVLQQERWFKEYVLHFTNAATIINDEYVDAEEGDGIFSGFDPETQEYEIDKANWHYAGERAAAAAAGTCRDKAPSRGARPQAAHEGGKPEHDLTLQHPNCVLNILRRHFARYTPEMVAETCGCTRGAVP